MGAGCVVRPFSLSMFLPDTPILTYCISGIALVTLITLVVGQLVIEFRKYVNAERNLLD